MQPVLVADMQHDEGGPGAPIPDKARILSGSAVEAVLLWKIQGVGITSPIAAMRKNIKPSQDCATAAELRKRIKPHTVVGLSTENKPLTPPEAVFYRLRRISTALTVDLGSLEPSSIVE